MSIQDLRERVAASSKAANHLLAEKGSAVWTKEDQATFDNHVSDIERVKNQIAAHEKMIELDREKNFSDVEKFRVDNSEKARADAESKKIFNTFLRKSFKEMTAEEQKSVMNTMSTTTGSQGGFTVQTSVASEMVDLLKAYGYMRRTSSQLTTGMGNDLNYPSSDGTSEIGEIVAQNTTSTNSDPVFGSVPFKVFKFGSKDIAVPIELIQDSQIDIQAMVMQRARDRIGRIQNQQFTIGDGSTGPNGLVTATSVGKTGVTGQTLTIIYDDLVDMVDSLDAAYLDVPVSVPQLATAAPGWMFSQTMRRVVRKLKDTAGRPIWTPSYDAGIGGRASTPDELLGYPVYINNDMPVPAANAKSLAFGNLHKYLIRDVMDVTMFRFDDSAYIKKGQIGFLAWARAGGNLLDVNSVKLYQHSAT